MKSFLLILLLVHMNFASTFMVNRIEGVDYNVLKASFDLNGNIYATTFSNITKINSTKQVVWTVNFPDYVDSTTLTYINNQEEVFVNAFTTDNTGGTILKKKSVGLERYDPSHNGVIVSVDKANYNLFYNRDNGVHVIRPNSEAPTPVKYLENFRIFVINFDKAGNAYAGVTSDVMSINAFVLITKEALQAKDPYAKFLKVLDDNYDQRVEGLVTDEGNNIWIFISDYTNSKGYIKKLSNDIVEHIFTDDVHPRIAGLFAKDKIYAVAADRKPSNPSIYYITLDNEVIEIPELKNLSLQYFQMWNSISDEDGYAYFKSWQILTPSLGSLVVVKPNEMKPIPIRTDNWILNNILLDFRDNLWIVTDGAGFYYSKKDSAEAELVSFPSNYCWNPNGIHLNEVTKEMFATCFDGLYIIAYEDE